MTNSDAEYQARCELAAAHRLAVMENMHEGSWNHLSLVHPERRDHILITPNNVHWSQVKASNLVLLGPDGETVGGDLKPNPAAWVIHHPIHAARSDAVCLIHSHPPYATALGMRKDGKVDPQCCQAAMLLCDSVAYFDCYDSALRDESDGERMAAALGDNRILMLRNHGVIVSGVSVAEAFFYLYMLERACMLQILASGSGDIELNKIPADVVGTTKRVLQQDISDAHFKGMRAVLDQHEPDYTT